VIFAKAKLVMFCEGRYYVRILNDDSQYVDYSFKRI